MLIKSVIGKHLVEKSDFTCMMIHLLNYCSDHIHQLPNLLNVRSELPEKAIWDPEQAYSQLNGYEAGLQILRTKAQRKVFQY
jgi:hypothetical protein